MKWQPCKLCTNSQSKSLNSLLQQAWLYKRHCVQREHYATSTELQRQKPTQAKAQTSSLVFENPPPSVPIT